MGWINDVFKRTNLHQIQTFLLYEDRSKRPQGSYEERMKKAKEPLYEFMEELFPNVSEREDAMSVIHTTLSDLEDIFMEIGMKWSQAAKRAGIIRREVNKPKEKITEQK